MTVENPTPALAEALKNVRLLTASRNATSADDGKVQLQLYAARLERWDQEIVQIALDTWPSMSPWWPAWHELEQHLLAIERLLARQLPELGDPGTGAEREELTLRELEELRSKLEALLNGQKPVIAYRPAQQRRVEEAIAWCQAHARRGERWLEQLEAALLVERGKGIVPCDVEVSFASQRWRYVEIRDKAFELTERLKEILAAWCADPRRELRRALGLPPTPVGETASVAKIRVAEKRRDPVFLGPGWTVTVQSPEPGDGSLPWNLYDDPL